MSFAQPDMTFTPGSFRVTGLQYLDDYYSTVKNSINQLKSKGVLHLLLAVQGLLGDCFPSQLPAAPLLQQPAPLTEGCSACGCAVACHSAGELWVWRGPTRDASDSLGAQGRACCLRSAAPHTPTGARRGVFRASQWPAEATHELGSTAVPYRNNVNNGAIAAFVADMGFNGARKLPRSVSSDCAKPYSWA
jgi:hypothetical protein